MHITEMHMAHYDGVIALIRRTPGVSVREADSREATERYLARNPGLSFVALEGDQIVGCALCGHDGRRGYLQHVVVEPAFRGQGLAHRLVTCCLDGLEKQGILKTHLDVFRTHVSAQHYWKRRGWTLRDDLVRYSFSRSNDPNV